MLKHARQVQMFGTSTSSLLRCRLSAVTRRTVVTKLTSTPHFEKAISEAPVGKHVMVNYISDSCEAHKNTVVAFERMSAVGDMLFFSVDCDEMSALAAQRGIDTLPTFETLKNGISLERIIGEDVFKIAEQCTDETKMLETAAGVTPLLIASMQGNVSTVRQLLKAGAKQTIFEDRNPLGNACSFGHSQVARMLLEDSLEHLNTKCLDGSTALITAVAHNEEDIVRLLTAQPSLEIDAQTNDGYTALYIAAHKGFGQIAKLLLNAGADSELRTAADNTPLIGASVKGHSEVVSILLPKVNVNATAPNGFSALHYAAYNGFGDVTRALMAHTSLDVNAHLKLGLTPLILAASMGHLEVVNALLANCSIRVNETDPGTGFNALHSAAEVGNEEVARALVAHPSLDVEAKCTDGRTALRVAADNGHESVVQMLLETGANP